MQVKSSGLSLALAWNVIDDLPLLIGHNTGLSLVNDILSRLMQIILEEAPGTQEALWRP